MYFYLVNMFVLNRSKSNVDLILLDVFCFFLGKQILRAKFVVHNLLYFIEWNVKNYFVKLI